MQPTQIEGVSPWCKKDQNVEQNNINSETKKRLNPSFMFLLICLLWKPAKDSDINSNHQPTRQNISRITKNKILPVILEHQILLLLDKKANIWALKYTQTVEIKNGQGEAPSKGSLLRHRPLTPKILWEDSLYSIIYVIMKSNINLCFCIAGTNLCLRCLKWTQC